MRLPLRAARASAAPIAAARRSAGAARRRSDAARRRDRGAGGAVRHRQVARCCIWPGCWNSRDGGKVLVDGRDAGALSDARAHGDPPRPIGFVYQFHHLLAEFSALENVVLPQMIAGVAAREARERARRRCWSRSAWRTRLEPSARQAVRRRAAARGDRPRAGQRARACCWPTSRPATSMSAPSDEVFDELLRVGARRRAWRR